MLSQREEVALRITAVAANLWATIRDKELAVEVAWQLYRQVWESLDEHYEDDLPEIAEVRDLIRAAKGSQASG